jgi:hypothetical protein
MEKGMSLLMSKVEVSRVRAANQVHFVGELARSCGIDLYQGRLQADRKEAESSGL